MKDIPYNKKTPNSLVLETRSNLKRYKKKYIHEKVGPYGLGQNSVYDIVFRKNRVMRIAFSHISKSLIKVFRFEFKYHNAISS